MIETPIPCPGCGARLRPHRDADAVTAPGACPRCRAPVPAPAPAGASEALTLSRAAPRPEPAESERIAPRYCLICSAAVESGWPACARCGAPLSWGPPADGGLARVLRFPRGSDLVRVVLLGGLGALALELAVFLLAEGPSRWPENLLGVVSLLTSLAAVLAFPYFRPSKKGQLVRRPTFAFLSLLVLLAAFLILVLGVCLGGGDV